MLVGLNFAFLSSLHIQIKLNKMALPLPYLLYVSVHVPHSMSLDKKDMYILRIEDGESQ